MKAGEGLSQIPSDRGTIGLGDNNVRSNVGKNNSIDARECQLGPGSERMGRVGHVRKNWSALAERRVSGLVVWTATEWHLLNVALEYLRVGDDWREGRDGGLPRRLLLGCGMIAGCS